MGTSLYSVYHDLVEGHFEHYYLLVSIVVALVVAVYSRLRHDGANTMGSQSYGCTHYRNRFRIRAPCCFGIFDCFRCHDEQRFVLHDMCGKILQRRSVKKVICSQCDREQDVKQVCENEECGIRMWDYYCGGCKLFYDAYSCHRFNFCCDRCGMKLKSTKKKIVDDKLFVKSKINGCNHYANRCRLRYECCDKVFDCWECHSKERKIGHPNGKCAPNKVICSSCDREQDVKQVCENEGCGACMADYYCANCRNFYDAYTADDWSYFCPNCERNLLISDKEYSICSASSLYPAATSLEYYSQRIANIIQVRKNNLAMDKVESEVDASKATWSELGTSAKYESIVEELEAFKSLQKKWPRFFRNGIVTVDEKIAEGAQAEIFKRSGDLNMVVKMFKEEWCLVDLEKLIPPTLKEGFRWSIPSKYYSWAGMRCNRVNHAIFVDGRLAFVMHKKWGDLRTVIDARMIHNNMQGPPFSVNVTALCMLEIALGMWYLHKMNILHRDLKTANVLVKGLLKNKLPLHGEFKCYVADFECSVGIVGTGFHRAPEILHALKNRALAPELFSKAADVYSYGMTCYEILTGRIPLEELPPNNFDKVIGGYRPKLPSRVPRWMKDLLTKCWDKDPCKRPTFDEIVQLVRKGVSKGDDLGLLCSKSLVMSLYSKAKAGYEDFKERGKIDI